MPLAVTAERAFRLRTQCLKLKRGEVQHHGSVEKSSSEGWCDMWFGPPCSGHKGAEFSQILTGKPSIFRDSRTQEPRVNGESPSIFKRKNPEGIFTGGDWRGPRTGSKLSASRSYPQHCVRGPFHDIWKVVSCSNLNLEVPEKIRTISAQRGVETRLVGVG